ncbi:F390 synthetase-related protein [Crassaminicella profunda]|uniref:F390 synthetase-related protein n=1 Tax=Crassaminicella profunda TaxID=1286698 RepID=UPI001CA771C5|nr:F390 synthetase-related protein [Crassaminicella profunda]QZY54021.1 CoF synthetase [Crassaminicella profunda]
MSESLKILYHYLKNKYFLKFDNRNELEAWQDRKVKDFLKNIVPKSPFYKKYYKNCSFDDWRNLPIMNKEMMMENFDELNVFGIKKEEAFGIALKAEKTRNFSPMINQITIGLSSGTSGNRGIFLVSPKERVKWAGNILAKCLPTNILHEQKIAFFLRADSNLYNTVNKGKIKFEFFDLLENIQEHIRRLNLYQPSFLVAPASMLVILAKKLEEGVLQINPKKVISVAEVLDPMDENYISKQFKQKIHQIYQCTEGFLATTCEHGTLHLNEDLLVVQKEYLDKRLGKFVPIITDFSRTSQPIIRYGLNDILTEKKEPCPCGSVYTALEQIEGRCDDLFYFQNEDETRLVPVFPDFIRRMIILSSSGIKQYKVNQLNASTIEVYIEVGKGYVVNEIRNKINIELQGLCKRLNCIAPHIKFIDEYEYIAGKKLRRIERKFTI